MQPFRTTERFSTLAFALALGTLGTPLVGQELPRVVLGRVSDDLVDRGLQTGGLSVELRIVGEGLGPFPAARLVAREVRDDTGRSLLPKFSPEEPGNWETSMGGVRISFEKPPRTVRSVTVSGTVEVLDPRRDPGAVVKVPSALARLDTPLVSPGLKAAGVEVTPLSPGRYRTELKKQKLDDARIARLRKDAKERGATDEKVEALIAEAKEADAMPAREVSKNAVILLGKIEDFRRIQSVEILDASGKEIGIESSGGESDWFEMETRRYEPASAPGPKATLVFTLVTDRTRVSVPFEFKNVPLP